MKKPISRRDFMGGVAVSAVGLGVMASPASAAFSASSRPESPPQKAYPPTKTGMRGNHAGSFEVAHQLAWDGEKPASYKYVDDVYDLIVVGGGISGLAAAYLFDKHSAGNQRMLILDNHDDFGGHAKRNEFHYKGKTYLGFGGAINLERPSEYSETTVRLLEEIGVDFSALADSVQGNYLLAGAGDKTAGLYLPHDQYDHACIVPTKFIHDFSGTGDYQSFVEALPLTQEEKAVLVSFIGGERDFLEGMSPGQKYDYLSSTPYRDFLEQKVGLSRRCTALFEPAIKVNEGLGIDSVSVIAAWAQGAPGLAAVGTLGRWANDLFLSSADYKANVFADGNSSIARLLVAALIPGVAGALSTGSVTSARFHYDRLDRPENTARIRLNSTAVGARNTDSGIEIDYVQDGLARRVKGKRCILACNNEIIAHMCDELPPHQKEALLFPEKTPLVWANVLLRTGEAFYQGGSETYLCPGSFFSLVCCAPPVAMPDFVVSRNPADPMVVFMAHAAAPENDGDQSARDLFRTGRHGIYAASFDDYEQQIREQLDGMFARFGFDNSKDIEAITVNRWPHGYAYTYRDLYDPAWPKGEAPHEIGRKRFGRISIANSDSEVTPYINGAIDAAWRAVKEQLFLIGREGA
ncbi:NAD(P)-binding protein [Kordiimonas lipolytica]|uniref:NAD(P)-binding protein n=1 Tax=Kordiimonas lipolytica TaxID=1662421 RepID=UPI00082AD0FF|nr:FAD/NAD(P)-binding protein [Kordiimonas lipolytica]